MKSSELTFSFERPDYGESFLGLNVGAEGPDSGAVAADLAEVDAGTRFIVYTYAVSVIVMSFKHPTGVRVIPPGGNAVLHGLPYALVSLLFGWWGIPHGPIFTIGSLVTNFRGGIDLTPAFAAVVRGQRVSATGA